MSTVAIELNVCLLCRFGGTDTPHEGSPGGPDGEMFKGQDNVCHESVQEECHDRDAVESETNVIGECFSHSNTMSRSLETVPR